MSRILVDTSIWIDYFTVSDSNSVIDELAVNNLVCTNDLILAELIPVIHLQQKNELGEALMSFRRYEILIDWAQIIQMQVSNLREGINGVGIPDLVILENVIANDLTLFARDKHFRLLKKIFDFKMFDDDQDKRR